MHHNRYIDSKSFTKDSELGREKRYLQNTPSLIIQQARDSLYEKDIKMTPSNKQKLQKSINLNRRT